MTAYAGNMLPTYAGNMLPDQRSEGATWGTAGTEISARSHGIRPSGLISQSTSLTQVEAFPLTPANDHDRIRRKHAARPAKRGRNLEDRTNGNQRSLARNPPVWPDLAEHLPDPGRVFTPRTAERSRPHTQETCCQTGEARAELGGPHERKSGLARSESARLS